MSGAGTRDGVSAAKETISTLDPRSRRAAGEGDYAGLGLRH